MLGRSRHIVCKLAVLFGLDAFAGNNAQTKPSPKSRKARAGNFAQSATGRLQEISPKTGIRQPCACTI